MVRPALAQPLHQGKTDLSDSRARKESCRLIEENEGRASMLKALAISTNAVTSGEGRSTRLSGERSGRPG